MVVIVYLVRHSWFVFLFFFHLYCFIATIMVNKASCLEKNDSTLFDNNDNFYSPSYVRNQQNNNNRRITIIIIIIIL